MVSQDLSVPEHHPWASSPLPPLPARVAWPEVPWEGMPRTQATREGEVTLPKLWQATLRALDKAGPKLVIARMIAKELALECRLPMRLRREHGSDRWDVLAPHLCGGDCQGTPGECLTALLVEALVEQRIGETVVARKCRVRSDRMCKILLAPLYCLLREPALIYRP